MIRAVAFVGSWSWSPRYTAAPHGYDFEVDIFPARVAEQQLRTRVAEQMGSFNRPGIGRNGHDRHAGQQPTDHRDHCVERGGCRNGSRARPADSPGHNEG